MPLLLISFIAGVLTVLAPCVLPLLPIIIGGSIQGQHKRNPYLITASLAVAIVLFTLLLKFSTVFINIPQSVWSSISGIIIIIFGLISVFPELWERLNIMLGLSNRSDQLLAESARVPSRWSDVLMGVSLGPVFSSCSPTYFLILATVLPRSFTAGLLYLAAYAIGLSLMLLLVSLLGQRFIQRARWAADPRGIFKRSLGVLFLIVGVLILTGADKRVQTFLVEKGFYPASQIEMSLLEKNQAISPADMDTAASVAQGKKSGPLYKEITNPSGFVNTNGITMGELVGKKVILVDFMTYSCINCIRTFPYLNAWYDKYKDQGLEIIGIHTPEFAFEHKIENVREAMKRYGIQFPVVLDNDYGTWNAYGNSYWPRKYLIDLDGHIVFDHIGEGGYQETEEKIQALLAEKAKREKTSVQASGFVSVSSTEPSVEMSPETYFGSSRNTFLANGQSQTPGPQTLTIPVGPSRPARSDLDGLYLSGTWNFHPEFAESTSAKAQISYQYHARDVFFVASASSTHRVKILRNGKPLTADIAGKDVQIDPKTKESYLLIKEERLYDIVHEKENTIETLELIIEKAGLQAYTFTFG